MKDKMHNMNSIIKNHKIENHVMSLEPWLWNRSSEEQIPWFSTGIAHLQCILLSESTYLLWTLRCNCVIGNKTYPHTSITTKWRHAIETRLNIDHRLAKANQKQNQNSKVTHTWSSIIADPESLPHDWTTNTEVLVGIRLPRPPD